MRYFTLNELTRSATAEAKGIKNIPDDSSKRMLEQLVDKVLDPAREAMGVPILVTSGYRSQELNKAVHGAEWSDHMLGCAADIVCKSPEDTARLFHYIKDNLEFSQLIWEAGDDNAPAWIHVSHKVIYNKKQVLRWIGGKLQPWR